MTAPPVVRPRAQSGRLEDGIQLLLGHEKKTRLVRLSRRAPPLRLWPIVVG